MERRHRADSATCLLVLLNLAIFAFECLQGGHPLASWRLYQDSYRFRPSQLVTSLFCHADYQHLASNLFGLYVFGRAVEEQTGASGLLFAYLFCGVVANVASKMLLRGYTVSLGASGAVFGLFVVAALTKLRPDWRSLIECFVLGQFAFAQVWKEAASHARVGVNKTAHMAGAAAGLLVFFIFRRFAKSRR